MPRTVKPRGDPKLEKKCYFRIFYLRNLLVSSPHILQSQIKYFPWFQNLISLFSASMQQIESNYLFLCLTWPLCYVTFHLTCNIIIVDTITAYLTGPVALFSNSMPHQSRPPMTPQTCFVFEMSWDREKEGGKWRVGMAILGEQAWNHTFIFYVCKVLEAQGAY